MSQFDEAFLRSVPTRPGIYLMLDEHDDLLYVGKAKSLRTRIRSYARLQPGEDARVDRLLAAVRRVRWEEAATDAEAVRRETELIRSLRPPYNTTHAQLSKYLAVAVAEDGPGLRFRLASEPAPTPTLERLYFYPFAAGTPVGFKALVRLLARLEALPRRREIPAHVTRSSGVLLEVRRALRGPLFSFLDGRSPRLVRLIELELVVKRELDLVHLVSIAKDLRNLRDFYRMGPRAVRRLQLVHGGEGPVSASDLNRLLAARHEAELGAAVRHRASNAQAQIADYNRLGLRAEEIVARLNHSADPRSAGSGRWRLADVLEILARIQEPRRFAEL